MQFEKIRSKAAATGERARILCKFPFAVSAVNEAPEEAHQGREEAGEKDKVSVTSHEI
jgi:hypothetical protein